MPLTHQETIPFFDKLAPAAIGPAARLWDKAKEPDYNGVTAYSEFIVDLADRNVSPPARAYVKRWVAGVQAGLIERPDGKSEAAAPGISASYFDALPEAAFPALQAAWDRAENKHFAVDVIYNSFSKDVQSLYLSPPPRPVFVQWINGVRAGDVERPSKQIAVDETAEKPLPPHAFKAKAEAERRDRALKAPASVVTAEAALADVPSIEAQPEAFEKITAAAFPAMVATVSPADTHIADLPRIEMASMPTLAPSAPLLIAAPVLDPPPGLRALRDQMVSDMVEQLTADARRQAAIIVAEQLRALAIELVPPAA